MSVILKVVSENTSKRPLPGQLVAYLEKDDWDDYSFRTSFNLTVFDKSNRYELGHVKIGYIGQTVPSDTVSYTFKHLLSSSNDLNDIFSLGQDVEYYSKLMTMSYKTRVLILERLNDVAFNLNILKKVKRESVFTESLLRVLDLSIIIEKFHPVLRGASGTTPFDFKFIFRNVELDFKTEPNSTPPSNIHVLIGRNGAGKTSLLNNMVYSELSYENGRYGGFFKRNSSHYEKIPTDYFPRVVLVSFSAFDSFEYPILYSELLGNNSDESSKFSYIGLKENLEKGSSSELKNKQKLKKEFIQSFKECMRFGHTKNLWLDAIHRLQSDDNFEDMHLSDLAGDNLLLSDTIEKADSLFSTMSSGHAIVLLTITKLIMEVKERTLVLLDEPEGHLHPPLLAAFMSSLSDLLVYRNGIAIIATHSPVVLQEVPKECVWNIIRYTQELTVVQRLETETYAENVGILTREVFGLEVKESGFHKNLAEYVDQGMSYERILSDHKNKLGLEGRSILRALTFNYDKRKGK